MNALHRAGLVSTDAELTRRRRVKNYRKSDMFKITALHRLGRIHNCLRS